MRTAITRVFRRGRASASGSTMTTFQNWAGTVTFTRLLPIVSAGPFRPVPPTPCGPAQM